MTAASPPIPQRDDAHRRASLPLERKLPLLILAVLSLVLATSLAVSYYEVSTSAQTSAVERLSTLSRSLSGLIRQTMMNRLGLMRRAATDTAVIASLSTPDRTPSPAARRAMSTFTAPSDSLTPPMLWTVDGRVVGNLRLEHADDAAAFRGELPSRPELVDSQYVGRLTARNGRAALWVAVPVRKNGQLIGYLAQERRFSASPAALQPFRDVLGNGIDLYLHNASGDVWTNLTGTIFSPPTRRSPFKKGLEVLTLGGREVLAATTELSGLPYVMTVAEPMDVIVARPRAVIRVLAVLSIVLVVVGGLIAWTMSRQIVKPLTELTGAAEAIAHGEYTRRVAATGSDEVERLGNAFNRMAEQVKVASDSSSQAVAQLTKSVATQQFLAEASRILATSLSDQSLLADLARYCVPTIADYCSIHVVDDDGTIRRVETVHRDPAKLPAVRALVSRYPFRVEDPGEVPGVIRSQLPLIIARLDLPTIRGHAPDDTTRALLDQIRPTSFMCVPLIARGRSVGAISFTMTDSGRIFAPEDLTLGMELARRTAAAVDNALIYRRSLALRLEAEAASSAKSDFLAKMSHEIRTPINAMMGYAELLEMGISGPVTVAQAKQLSRIRASGEHLTSLVNEILDFSKIEAGGMRVEPSTGTASDAADAALALIRPQATTKGVEVSGKPDGQERVTYLGDPQRVQQILTNLLSNAVKFTPAGGRVSVTWKLVDRPDLVLPEGGRSWATITVEDTGVGIAEADLERVFDPFVQVDEGYTRAQGGTGLGLSISRKLAEMMGGLITVESAPGKGSRFTVWLPSPDSCTSDA